MPKLIDLTGQLFDKLRVESFSHRKNRHTYWNCACNCGRKTVASTNNLRRGKHLSCGCGHGLSRTPEYETWYNIKLRCGLIRDQPAKPGYDDIGVYPAWAESFDKFLEDVGHRPASGMSMDRIDPSKGYLPGNVRWATRIEQNRNKRRHATVLLPSGEMLTTWEYAKLIGSTVKGAWQNAAKKGWLLKTKDG